MKRLKDFLRTLLGIRKPRRIAPVSARPPAGSHIARERLRMRLRHPLTEEQWTWLQRMGWRVIDMRNERRRYTAVPDMVLNRLLKAHGLHRDAIHARLIAAAQKRARRKDQAAR